MGFFNFVITVIVGAVLLVGAGMTYHYRSMEAEVEGNPLSGVAIVSPSQFVKNVAAQQAALPKWEDKNYKGLTYHEPGYYKKKAEAERKAAEEKAEADKKVEADKKASKQAAR